MSDKEVGALRKSIDTTVGVYTFLLIVALAIVTLSLTHTINKLQSILCEQQKVESCK